jgi:hypothetical protein
MVRHAPQGVKRRPCLRPSCLARGHRCPCTVQSRVTQHLVTHWSNRHSRMPPLHRQVPQLGPCRCALDLPGLAYPPCCAGRRHCAVHSGPKRPQGRGDAAAGQGRQPRRENTGPVTGVGARQSSRLHSLKIRIHFCLPTRPTSNTPMGVEACQYGQLIGLLVGGMRLGSGLG